MSATITETAPSATISVTASTEKKEEPYRYAHLLPVFSNEKLPPLTPFTHVDAGSRALKHSNPRAFLDNANVVELTPGLGSDVTGVNLAELSPDAKDQLALEVARRGVVVFRNQQDFIDRGAKFYTEWGRHFGRLHIHPSSGHPEGVPEIHLVYKDANSKFNSEVITSTLWHSDFSFELQPPGLTTFFLLSQPKTGGDTLYSSQVSNLKRLSPTFVNFLKTLKAVHSGFGTLRASRNGGAERRDPIETVHPVVRRHPVTGEEALFVNKQFTKRIVGLKREESENLLNFLYDHISKAGDNQARIKWSPNSMILWDNRITAHSAIADYGHLGARRHGARITPQAERPIPALDSLVFDD